MATQETMHTSFMKIIENRNELIKKVPKGLIWAELGVFDGEYSEQILKWAKPKRLYLVDIWKGSWLSGDKDGTNERSYPDMQQVMEDLKKKFKKEPVKFCQMTTDDFYKTYRFCFDVVYIDADHSFESVKRDLENAYAQGCPYILGHDYNKKRFPDCVRAVDEFCEARGLEIKYLTEDGCPSYLIETI